ncbi:hypothetical protein CPB85DRAFT_1443213 [Mucidula mucida]|nr:hypothetical protein CPB85DRAFT_1443213 [Mucidula mucida]
MAISIRPATIGLASSLRDQNVTFLFGAGARCVLSSSSELSESRGSAPLGSGCRAYGRVDHPWGSGCQAAAGWITSLNILGVGLAAGWITLGVLGVGLAAGWITSLNILGVGLAAGWITALDVLHYGRWLQRDGLNAVKFQISSLRLCVP